MSALRDMAERFPVGPTSSDFCTATFWDADDVGHAVTGYVERENGRYHVVDVTIDGEQVSDGDVPLNVRDALVEAFAEACQ